MHLKVFSILAVVQVVFSQGITFQDGRLGVNFGGYNADVGFGPGGLSASAGTPNGQRAEAGLGGTVNGNTAGGLYAGATAGQGIGASASLGGDVNNGFGSGQAQASAGGVSKSVVKTVSTNVDVETKTDVDSTQYQIPIAMQSVVTQAPVVVVPQVDQVESHVDVDTNVDVEAPYPPRTTPISVTETTVGPVQYLPPTTAVVAPNPSLTAQGSGSSVSTSTFDADDNDLTHNTVPQTTNVVAQQPQPVDQQVVVQQTVPQVVNVQKIKVRRPRPSTYTVYQKQFQIPTFVSKTIQYPAPVYQQQAAPVQITQVPIPAYQPVVYQKRIQINTVPQVAVEQRFEEVAPTQGPTTPTTTTTPRPVYQYTYDKTKVINEIFSIPYHILNSVNNLINAKLAGGYQVQKTVTYN